MRSPTVAALVVLTIVGPLTSRAQEGASWWSVVATAAGEYCSVALTSGPFGARRSLCIAKAGAAEGPPAPPVAARGEVYSARSAEIFWERSPDHGALAGYEVRRDGVGLAFHLGQSHFDDDLDTSLAHDYEIIAVGANGLRSAPARLRLGEGLPLAERRSPRRALSLTLGTTRSSLVEGDAGGVSVALLLRRRGPLARAVRFSLEADSPDDLADLDYRFGRSPLDARAARTTLRLALAPGMAARLPQERRLRVRADDGRSVAEAVLTVEVRPIDADDVYLLIGQSNMEGYSEPDAKRAGPGEPDAPHPRVRQLHVRPNSRAVFHDPERFVDEATNVASPLFIEAEDPLHDPRSALDGEKRGGFVGPALSFAKAMLGGTTRTIYLVPAAWGATGFCANAMGEVAWNARPYPVEAHGGSLLVERALKRLEITLRETGGILRGILWHQGGADSHDRRCAERYAENLAALVRRLRSEAPLDPRGPAARGPDAPIPFVVATMSRGRDGRGDYSRFHEEKRIVDAVHRDVAGLIPHADFVNADDLVPPAYPCGANSCVHYGAAANREQGRRFARAIERIVRR